MAAVILNGHTYSLAILSGTDGLDYADAEPFTGSGATLWDMFFTDLFAQIQTSVLTTPGIAPGAQYGFIRSNGTNWARVSGITPSTDLNAAVPYTQGGTGLTALGTASQYLQTNAGATAIEWATLGAGASYAIINGGTADTLTHSSWSRRTIDTEVYDPSAIVTISSSQFTLQAGTYLIHGDAAGHLDSTGNRDMSARIRNMTDSTDAISSVTTAMSMDALGVAARGATTGRAPIRGTITIAGAKAFEYQQLVPAFGTGGIVSGSAETDKYVTIFIIKLA